MEVIEARDPLRHFLSVSRGLAFTYEGSVLPSIISESVTSHGEDMSLRASDDGVTHWLIMARVLDGKGRIPGITLIERLADLMDVS